VGALDKRDEACVFAIEVRLNLGHVWAQLLNYSIDPLNIEHDLLPQTTLKLSRIAARS
jgi:hypothetical protein